MSSTLKRKKSTTSVSKQNTRISKEELMLRWAEFCSMRSSCYRLMVGAVITDPTMKVVKGYGYNGNYAGGPNGCDSEEPGHCECIHAEINALLKASIDVGDIMFVTDAPCLNCAKCIINSGIKVVYYRRDYRINDGLNLLKKIIKVIKI